MAEEPSDPIQDLAQRVTRMEMELHVLRECVYRRTAHFDTVVRDQTTRINQVLTRFENEISRLISTQIIAVVCVLALLIITAVFIAHLVMRYI